MSDQELLHALSDMLDQKLDTRLKPMEEDIKSLKSDVKELKDDVTVLKEDVAGLKEDVTVLKADVTGLKENVAVLKEDVETLKENYASLNDELHRVKLFQENVILPRLNTIESCYTGTYKRYLRAAEKMEAALEDVELLKEVTAKHSQEIQKLQQEQYRQQQVVNG